MLRRLLVPLDGSEAAETILPWTLFLAREKRLSLTLAGAVRSAVGNGRGADSQLGGENGQVTPDSRWESVRRYLDALRERLAAEGDDVEIAICEGSPVQTLLDLVDQVDASAIVLATHGEGNRREDPLGAVTEQILQEATVPVLLVPAGRGAVGRPPSLRRLLVPLDGSALAERALDVAAELAAHGASVRLVRVVEPALETLDTAEGGLPIEDADATGRARAEAATYLQNASRTIEGDRLAVQTSVALGGPDRQILTMARDDEADLIVMVTHGMSGRGRGWLGSVANAIVHRTSTPVFLVSARSLVARVGRSFRVADVMTSDPVTVHEDDSLALVLRRLLRCRVSGAPVVADDGTLLGVITELDLLRWQLEAARARSAEPSADMPTISELLASTCASRVMSHLAVSVEDTVELASAVPILLNLPYRRLPVTHDGRLVGILSRADVLEALAEQDSVEIESMVTEMSGVS